MARTVLSLRTCRVCGVPLRWRGYGRPPSLCADHRPSNYPKGRHEVCAQVSGDVAMAREAANAKRRARRAADRQLRIAHPDEWQGYYAEAIA